MKDARTDRPILASEKEICSHHFHEVFDEVKSVLPDDDEALRRDIR
jgi:hypothetical protein